MKIHEYQAKAIFRNHGIPTPRGGVANTVEEAVQQAQQLGGSRWVIKAQIHAGGRGKGGGVQIASDLDAVRHHASAMLGSHLITPQTDAAGTMVHTLLIEEACAIVSEHYISFLLDRGSQRIVCIASAEGGGDIEEVAARSPESIHRETIDPLLGLQPFQARRLAYALHIPKEQMRATANLLSQLYAVFMTHDCSLLEVNPLVLSESGEVLALDGKVIFDDNALFRHPKLASLRDLREEDEREQAAEQQGLSYVSLEGNIGCMVNGAGLAMATMDILNYFGGRPANFLDVGGGATAERVEAAFHILMNDPQVQTVFINIFGGIVRCDILAEGLIAAAAKASRLCPLVVRLEGTRAKEGLAALQKSNLPITTASAMDQGAELAVRKAQEESAKLGRGNSH